MMAIVGAQYLVVVAEVAVVALVVVAVTAVVVEVGVGAVVVVSLEVTVIAPVAVSSFYSEDQTDKDEDLCSINAVFHTEPSPWRLLLRLGHKEEAVHRRKRRRGTREERAKKAAGR